MVADNVLLYVVCSVINYFRLGGLAAFKVFLWVLWVLGARDLGTW